MALKIPISIVGIDLTIIRERLRRKGQIHEKGSYIISRKQERIAGIRAERAEIAVSHREGQAKIGGGLIQSELTNGAPVRVYRRLAVANHRRAVEFLPGQSN